MIMKVLLYSQIRIEVHIGHTSYLISRQVKVVVVLALKAKALFTMAYTSCF